MIESLPERPNAGSTVIRRLTPADVPAIVAIENDTFTLPWHPNVFLTLLTKREALCLGCLADGRLIGYLIADMFVDVWHIMNLAVSAGRRRRHIASDLLAAYFEMTEREAHRGHTLEVRVSNEPAIELYRSYGFVATGVRRGYYSDNREDALIMWKEWEGDSA
jgi:ribosomal-protein-alanine N-acetyltransferase